MSWVAVAIAGSAVLGVAGNAASGVLGAEAAGSASRAQFGMINQEHARLNSLQALLRQYFDPFIQSGRLASDKLMLQAVTPQELESQRKLERARLVAARPSPPTTGDYKQYGPQYNQWRTDMQAWEDRIKQFDAETPVLLERAQTAANTSTQDTPAFRQQVELTNRALAAQGLLGSERAIAEQANVAANAFNSERSLLAGLAGQGVQSVSSLSGSLVPIGATQAELGVRGGQALAAGELGRAGAITGAISGGVNSVTGAGSTLLNYNLYSKLIGGLNTGSGGFDPVMGRGLQQGPTNYRDYLNSSLGTNFSLTGS